MIERRKVDRVAVDLTVRKHIDGQAYFCRACEISSTGIRLKRVFDVDPGETLVDIEVPLVAGQLTTAVPSRRIWRGRGYEAFEFVGSSFAQKTILKRVFGSA
ncbi:MAG: PilZ domain-containing protein [Myxococcota bacterium]|nr:PilZ domain-containing protein [Myxococcota bacterium]